MSNLPSVRPTPQTEAAMPDLRGATGTVEATHGGWVVIDWHRLPWRSTMPQSAVVTVDRKDEAAC